MDKKKELKFKSSEIEMLRSGMNDNVNLLVDDELSDIFGGCKVCIPGGSPFYSANKCQPLYCESKFSSK